MRNRRIVNPFYALLVVAGVAFCVTAFAYGVMAFRGQHPDTATTEPPPLMALMDRHGASILGVELALLGICTVGAISSDNYWSRRSQK